MKNSMNSSLHLFLSILTLSIVAACGQGEKNYADRMAQEHDGDAPVKNASVQYKQLQAVDTMTVNYAETDSGAISGYFATPEDGDKNLPGIIVIHEWWGLNDNIRMMTRRLAGLGFDALAVDLYSGKVAESPEMARQYIQIAMSNIEGTINNLKQAYTYLVEEQDAENVGVIGWCFGGGWSLATALALPDKIDATVIYYGRLVTDTEQLRTLSMPILAFFGGQDQSIPQQKINTFEDNLKKLGKNIQVYVYDNAGHAFANPSGTRYNKEAAQDAWQRTKAFFKKHLKN